MDWVFLGGVAYFSNDQIRASYTAVDGLGTGRVSDFQFDDDGTLWASTEGGLSRLKNHLVATGPRSAPEYPTCLYGPEAALRLAGPGNQEGVGRQRDRRVLPTTNFGELV